MRANRPVASAKAKPRTAYEKSWPAIDDMCQLGRIVEHANRCVCVRYIAVHAAAPKHEKKKAKKRRYLDFFLPRMAGLRATPLMRAPKTVPIPTPAPARPIVAAPAPCTLAAVTMAAAVDSTTTLRDCMALRIMVEAKAVRPPLSSRPLRPAAPRAVEMVDMIELGTRARVATTW